MNENKTIGKIKAPSKINLYLKVTGKRDDGYHEIESLFVPLSDPCDEITISESVTAGIIIDSDSNNIPLDESNICYKAALEFAKFADIEPRWKIHIKKAIPVAAGLGGGSSDAAAVLKILNENVKKIDDSELIKIAASIGADVPFFLNPVPSIGKGIGEILEPVDLKSDLSLVLVNPKFPVSAKWGYGELGSRCGIRDSRSEIRDPREENTDYGIDDLLDTLNSGGIPENILNDLAPAVFEKFPIMGILAEKMRESGALCVGMSGSGPTLFGIFNSCETAANLAEKMKAEYGPAIWIAESEIC
jgi:4-diphosphocytidyl-2-C-methyl-D-erythritol kinase